jgi:hypothetical protein
MPVKAAEGWLCAWRLLGARKRPNAAVISKRIRADIGLSMEFLAAHPTTR